MVCHHPCTEAATTRKQGPDTSQDRLRPVRKRGVSRLLQEGSNVRRYVGADRCTRVGRGREDSRTIHGQEKRHLLDDVALHASVRADQQNAAIAAPAAIMG